MLICSAQPVVAQMTKITYRLELAISGDAMPGWIAKYAELFVKNGLDVELVFFTRWNYDDDGSGFRRHPDCTTSWARRSNLRPGRLRL